jgi:diadenosine tetraphosphate (Ap4A) HIT family hydrolase
MTSQSDCKICLGQWPRPDHEIADLGLLAAYLHEDQFFPGWTVLIFKGHVTEIFHLHRAERHDVMDRITEVSQALANIFHPVKINYALLGNQLPHMHWHLVPRLTDDPAPRDAVWGVQHQPKRLTGEELSMRLSQIRGALAQVPGDSISRQAF